MFRQEMACQITHDSIHYREGWTREYALSASTTVVGYGSVAIAGPWKDKPTVYEFYITPGLRDRACAFELFKALLAASDAVAIEAQTCCELLTVMFRSLVTEVLNEKVVFRDDHKTAMPAIGVLRRATPADASQFAANQLDESAQWVIELDGGVVATGGILYHYNRPYGDIYMAVNERYRRRGIGAYLVQELKRICYEGGSIPAARCSPGNIASRRTLQKAGLFPYCNTLSGPIDPARREAL
jgi:GNAT superfamily N-acetyltransferase